MSPRRVLAATLLAFGASGALAWIRPLGYNAPAWSFFLLIGVIAIASGAWTALFLPLAATELRWRVTQIATALLPALAIAIPAEWMLKMVIRGQLVSAPTNEILAASRAEASLYAVLLVAGFAAWLLHFIRGQAVQRRLLGRSLAAIALVPISVWVTRLDLPMLIGALTQVLVGLALVLEALRPSLRQPHATSVREAPEPRA